MRRLAFIVMMLIISCMPAAPAATETVSLKAEQSGVFPGGASKAADIAVPAAVSSPAELLSDRELSTYELTAVAVAMNTARVKARTASLASAPVDSGEIVDPKTERATLEGMVRSHAETGDRGAVKNRLESARLDQKLLSSRGQIMRTRLSNLESQAGQLKKEIDGAREEMKESAALRSELEKRLFTLEQAGDTMGLQELLRRKKAALADLIVARNVFEKALDSLARAGESRLRKIEEQTAAGRSTIALYDELDAKITVIVSELEESVKRIGVESAAKRAKEAADSARSEIESVDKKLVDIDNELVSGKTASSTSIAAKSEMVARRDFLLSRKDALTERVRLSELQGRSAADIAQFEEIERRASTGSVATGQFLNLGRKEWLPTLDRALNEYQHEKRLVEKRTELLQSTREMVDQVVSEKPDPGKRDETRHHRQQLAEIQSSLQSLVEQKEVYDALIRHAFSAKQTVKNAIDSELERRLFARRRFQPRAGLAASLLKDITGIPAAVSARVSLFFGMLSFGLLAQLLFTIAVCIGAGWGLRRIRAETAPSGDPETLRQWFRDNGYLLSALGILGAIGVQVDELTPVLIVPVVILATFLAARFVERTFLRRLPEKHILRNAFEWILFILVAGAPAIYLLRWFRIYREIAFVIGLACKVAMIWPVINLIKGSSAFYGLMQYHFDLRSDSKLLKFTVLAYRFISVLNLVCLLTAVYGYENLALFVFWRNIEAFGIIMLIAVAKPVAERLATRLFDQESGLAAAYVGEERSQFLLFVGKKAFLLLAYLAAALAAASFAGITTDSAPVRFVADWLVGQSDWLVAKSIRVCIIIIAIILVLKFVQTLGESVIEYVKNESRSSLTENERRASTLVQIINTSVRVVLFCIGGIMILRELGMDITPLLTGAGIVGVAIGFGSQSLVKDFFAGFFILVENQFRVGDVIEISGRAGVVERINLKTTVLRATDGSVFIIPNGEITSVKNMTYAWSRAVLDIGVAYDTDLDEALEILQKVGDELAADPALAADIWGRPEVLGVENLDNSSIVLRMLVKTRPLTQWQVSRIFRKKIKEAFDKARIEIPFPQQVVTLKADPEMMKLIQGLGRPKTDRSDPEM